MLITEPLRIGTSETTPTGGHKVQIEPVDRSKLAVGYAWSAHSFISALAYAKLFAAAPTMYQALQQWLQWYGKDEPEHPASVAGQLTAMMRAALAKAEGRAQ